MRRTDMSELSLFLVLVLAPRVFLRVLRFFSLQILTRSGNEGHRFVSFAVSVTLTI